MYATAKLVFLFSLSLSLPGLAYKTPLYTVYMPAFWPIEPFEGHFGGYGCTILSDRTFYLGGDTLGELSRDAVTGKVQCPTGTQYTADTAAISHYARIECFARFSTKR